MSGDVVAPPLGGCDAQAIQAIRQATGFTPRVE